MNAQTKAQAKGPVTPPPPQLDFAPIQDPKLRPRDCQVLWALAWWAWGSKPYLWATNETIAELLNCSARTVAYSLARLEAEGYIARHMNRCNTGWYRSIVITARVPRPRLAIVEPPETPVTGRATPCKTPPQPVATPVLQPVAFEGFRSDQEEEKKSEPPPGREGRGPAARKDKAGDTGPANWQKLDHLTPAELEGYRAVAADPQNPFARLAEKIVARYEAEYPGMRASTEGKAGSGPPTKESPDPASRDQSEVADSVQEDLTKFGKTDQDKTVRIEHKTH